MMPSAIDDPDPRAPGPKAMAALGDILLENDLVRVILDAPDHPQGLAPSGGSIIDFSPRDPATKTLLGDQANGIYQAAGLLPRDAVRYTSHQDVRRTRRVGPLAALRGGRVPRHPRR